jgi:hypothetical protein
VTISALNALAIHLGSLSHARKTIVLVSEGSRAVSVGAGSSRCRRSTRSFARRTGQRVDLHGRSPEHSEGRQRCGRGRRQSRETLRTLAGETDGEAIVNANDLEGGMRRIAGDSSAYYLITYRSAGAEDGKFHAIRCA